MTHPQRISTFFLIMLGIVWFAGMAWVIDRKEMGYKQSVIRAIQSKSPAQKLHVEPAFNPQKVSWSEYLPPLPRKKLLP